MKCEYCGKEFKRTFRGPRKFCSKQCGMNFHNEKNNKKKEKVKKCIVCGKEFTGQRRLYCSAECYSTDNKYRAKQEMLEELKEMQELKKAPEPKKPKKPKISAAEINAIARAEGLSYGQCVAKYGY